LVGKKLISSQKQYWWALFLPRKKFNREEADKLWKNYTANLIDSISDAEKEGLEKGYSSYQIETLWQEKVKATVSKKENIEKKEDL
jgi:hypothetical protein